MAESQNGRIGIAGFQTVRSSRIRTDPARDEDSHQPPPQLVGNPALVERLRLEFHPDGGGAVGQRFDADDVERRQDQRSPHRVLLHRHADLPDGSEHAIDVFVVGHADVDDRVGKLFAEVCQRRDGAVRKYLYRAFDVPKHDGAQVDLFDAAGDAVDASQITDADLVLEDQKEARDDVAHQILRPEADGQAGDAGAGQDRHDVDGQLAHHHQDPDEHDRDRDQAGEDAAERRGTPLPFEIGRRVAPRELELQVVDRQVGRAHDDEGADQDDGHVDAMRHGPVQEIARLPGRLGISETVEGERDAGDGGDAIGEQRQRPNQLLRAGMNRRAVFGADDLERAEQPMDDRVRDADGHGGDDEREDNDTNRGVANGGHRFGLTTSGS